MHEVAGYRCALHEVACRQPRSANGLQSIALARVPLQNASRGNSVVVGSLAAVHASKRRGGRVTFMPMREVLRRLSG